ncbi:hypothetical protein GCM10009525_38220 [Streptosporangium amethystogenes subsp. fukuiense]
MTNTVHDAIRPLCDIRARFGIPASLIRRVSRMERSRITASVLTSAPGLATRQIEVPPAVENRSQTGPAAAGRAEVSPSGTPATWPAAVRNISRPGRSTPPSAAGAETGTGSRRAAQAA